MINIIRRLLIRLIFNPLDRYYLKDVLLRDEKENINLAIRPGLEKSLMRFHMRSSGRARSLAELFE
jgi:hypothetical protein